MVLQNNIELLNPPVELEKKKHKLKCLLQSPNSFFMDVKCQGFFNICHVLKRSLLRFWKLTGGIARNDQGWHF
ncbi:hypothetical protein UlMin_025977 [Ulmus minor]